MHLPVPPSQNDQPKILFTWLHNSIRYFLALKNHNVKAELHVFEKGGHGFGLGREDTSKYWTYDCENWLRVNNFL